MLEVWVITSFVLAFGIVLRSFRQRDVAQWRSRPMQAFVLLWYLTGFLGWWVAKRPEALMGGLLVSIAWHAASASARRVPKTRTKEVPVDDPTLASAGD
jgi:hypothetical protein